jgi:hypothetical protein
MTATTSTPTGLPTEKRAPRAGVGKLWIYGDAGIGKSTTAIDMYPDAYVMDTEGSTTALEGLIEDIGNWELFRKRIGELETAREGNPEAWPAVIVDTVDVLAKLCGDSVLMGLAGGGAAPDTLKARLASNPGEGYLHASDFDYGKGWSAITDEFSLRIAKLCAVVPNVIFISHSVEETVKPRSGIERQVSRPELAPRGLRSWLEGFVDHIAFAEIDSESNRVLHMQPSADYLAKCRVPRAVKAPADPMAMRGPVLRKALERLGSGS